MVKYIVSQLASGIHINGNICFASNVLHVCLNQKLFRELVLDTEQSLSESYMLVCMEIASNPSSKYVHPKSGKCIISALRCLNTLVANHDIIYYIGACVKVTMGGGTVPLPIL